jgi:hypothetical protein
VEHIRLYSCTLEDPAVTGSGCPGWCHSRAAAELAHFHHREIELAQKGSRPYCRRGLQRHRCSHGLEGDMSLSAEIPPRCVLPRSQRATEAEPIPWDQRHNLIRSLRAVGNYCATQNRMIAFGVVGLLAEDHKSWGVNACHLGLTPY